MKVWPVANEDMHGKDESRPAITGVTGYSDSPGNWQLKWHVCVYTQLIIITTRKLRE